MDWLCPGYTRPLSAQIKKAWGSLTPELIISDITALVTTGDVHIAVYDLTEQIMFVSFMASDPSMVPQMAYDRPFTRLDLKTLFALPPPALVEGLPAPRN